MIWVGILEIGFAVMLLIAVIVAIIKDFKYRHDKLPEYEPYQSQDTSRICGTCRYSEQIYSDPDCVYLLCTEGGETVTKHTTCDYWQAKAEPDE